MNRNFFERFSMVLINQVEHDCAVQDPEMGDAAAMVLVGDVYALLICGDEAPPSRTVVEAPARENGLLPFIR